MTEKMIKTGIFENMPNIGFKMMTFAMKMMDIIMPRYVPNRVKWFDIKDGMILVDYGCGPARYTKHFSERVGENGKVYAVDVQPLAVKSAESVVKRHGLCNVETRLADGYNSGVTDNVADVVYALDMFHGVANPTHLLAELKRIAKDGATLVIDDGHQSRTETKAKIARSGCWEIIYEDRSHLKCKPC